MPATGGSTRGLEISFSLKPSEAQAVSRVFQQIIKSIQDAEKAASKLNQTIGSATGGVGSSQQSKGLSALVGRDSKTVKGLQETSKTFEQLASVSGRSLKILTEQTERDVEKQRKAYQSLLDSVKRVEDAYERTKARGGGGSLLEDLAGEVGKRNAEAKSAGELLEKMEGALGRNKPAQEEEASQSRLANKIAMALGGSQLLRSVGSAFMTSQTAPIFNKAAIAGTYGSMYNNYIQGDFSDFLALQLGRFDKTPANLFGGPQEYADGHYLLQASSDLKKKLALDAGLDIVEGGLTTGVKVVGAVAAGSLAGPAGSLAAGALAANTGSSLNQISSGFSNLALGGREAAQSQFQQSALQAMKQAHPREMAAMMDFMNSANARMNSAQTQGGFAAYIRNVFGGVGYGMEEGQSAALMAGLTGQLGSRRGNAAFEFAAGAQRNFGIRRDSMPGLLAGFDAGNSSATSIDRFEEVMTRAFAAGIEDSQALEKIAAAVGQSQYSLSGGSALSLGGFASFINAIGPDPSQSRIGEFAGALDMSKRLFGGTTGGLKAQEMNAAQRALQAGGFSGSVLEAGALSGASLTDLMGGGNEKLRAIFGGKTGAATSAYLKTAMAEKMSALLSPELRAVFEKSGWAGLNTTRNRALFGQNMEMQGMGAGQEAEAFVEWMAAGGRSRGANVRNRGGDAGLAGEAAVGAATAKTDPFKRVVGDKNLQEQIQNAVQGAELFFQTMTDSNHNYKQALGDAEVALRKAIEALERFTGALGKTRVTSDIRPPSKATNVQSPFANRTCPLH